MRTGRILTLLLAAALVLPAVASAALKKGSLVLPGLPVELMTLDGWTLNAKYLPSRGDRKTFLLLHGTGRRKEHWSALVKSLVKEGFGYFALDFRGHGKSSTGPDGQPVSWKRFRVSKKHNDFMNMARDVEAAVAYLNEQGVAESQIGIIGSDVGSSIGLKYAAVHPEIPMALMLSPGLSYKEVLTVNAMRAYKNRPILMIYSEKDKISSKATPLLAGFARLSTGEANTTVINVERGHGTRMLRRELIGQIIDWIFEPGNLLPEEEDEYSEEGDGYGEDASAEGDGLEDGLDGAGPDETIR